MNTRRADWRSRDGQVWAGWQGTTFLGVVNRRARGMQWGAYDMFGRDLGLFLSRASAQRAVEEQHA